MNDAHRKPLPGTSLDYFDAREAVEALDREVAPGVPYPAILVELRERTDGMHETDRLGSRRVESDTGQEELARGRCAERDPSKLPWGQLGVEIVLEVDDLHVEFRTRDAVVHAVELYLAARPEAAERLSGN